MKIAYDIKLLRPGCALLQAAMGGDPLIAYEFDTEHWLLAPTEDIRVYEVTRGQLKILVKKTEGNRGKN